MTLRATASESRLAARCSRVSGTRPPRPPPGGPLGGPPDGAFAGRAAGGAVTGGAGAAGAGRAVAAVAPVPLGAGAVVGVLLRAQESPATRTAASATRTTRFIDNS